MILIILPLLFRCYMITVQLNHGTGAGPHDDAGEALNERTDADMIDSIKKTIRIAAGQEEDIRMIELAPCDSLTIFVIMQDPYIPSFYAVAHEFCSNLLVLSSVFSVFPIKILCTPDIILMIGPGDDLYMHFRLDNLSKSIVSIWLTEIIDI